MIIRCQFCETRFSIPDGKLPPAGTLVRCSNCRATFWVNPSALQPEANESHWNLEPEPTTHQASSQTSDNAPLGVNEFFEEAPRTPPPSSVPTPKESDSWWDLPEINNQKVPPPSREREPDESWLDLPEIPEATSSPKTSDSAQPTKKVLEPSSPPHPSSGGVLGGVLEPKKPQTLTPRSAPKTTQAKNTPSDKAEPPPHEEEAPSVEFLLRDRSQQRQELWYTAIPMIVRSCFLVGFFLVFAWLWTSLEYGTFTRKNLEWKRLKSTFVGESSHWSIRKIRYQWRKRKRGQYLVIQGSLQNTHHQSRREPDLVIRYTHTKTNQRTGRMRCCRQPTPTRLNTLHSSSQIRGWQRALRRHSRKVLAAGTSTTFALLWVPPKNVRDIEIRVVEPPSSRRKRPALKPRKRKRQPPKSSTSGSNDEDDDDDDDDE